MRAEMGRLFGKRLNMNSPNAPVPPANLARRFTLSQLVLWLFATCIVLAHESWRLKSNPNLSSTFQIYFNVNLLLTAPIHGACFAGLLLWTWRRIRGGKQLGSSPGHWLLIILGAQFVAGAADEYFIWAFGENSYQSLPAWASLMRHALFSVFEISVLGAAVLRFRDQRLWQAAFAAMMLGPLASIVHSTLVTYIRGNPWFLDELAWGLGTRVLFSLPAIITIAALTSDRRGGVRHDFLHYVGASVVIINGIIEWPRYIVWRILFR
jgi:hypothetical protein